MLVVFHSAQHIHISFKLLVNLQRKIYRKNFLSYYNSFFCSFFFRLQSITAQIAQLAMTSQVLPQRAACALHLVYAVSCGAKFILNPEEYIDSLSTIFVQSECDVSKKEYLTKEHKIDESYFNFIFYSVYSSISIPSWIIRWFNHVNISHCSNCKFKIIFKRLKSILFMNKGSAKVNWYFDRLWLILHIMATTSCCFSFILSK